MHISDEIQELAAHQALYGEERATKAIISLLRSIKNAEPNQVTKVSIGEVNITYTSPYRNIIGGI